MDSAVREQVNKKDDISFVLAKESVPFTEYPAIHESEERHRVDLGLMYKNRDSAILCITLLKAKGNSSMVGSYPFIATLS